MLVEDGVVTQVAPGVERPAGSRRSTPRAAGSSRGCGTSTCTSPSGSRAGSGSTWPAPPRSRRPRPRWRGGSLRSPAGRSSAGATARPSWAATGPPPSSTPSRPRCRSCSSAATPTTRWANTLAYNLLGLPVRGRRGARERVVRRLPADRRPRRRPTDSADAYREALAAAAALGVVGLVDFEFNGRAPAVGGPLARRLRPAAGPLGDVRRRAGRGHRVRAAHRRPPPGAQPRRGRPADHGTAEDHQRRLAQHPHRLVLRPLRRRRRASSTRPACPTSPAPSCAPCSAAPRRAASRSPPTRSATRPSTEALTAYAETWATGSIEHAQLVQRDDVRRMAELGLRASVQPAHLLDDRDLTERIWPGRGERCFAFRWMLDAGVRAGARLGRPGLAARPVAGDRGRRAPQRRRPRPVARRAGAHPGRGAGRVGRRPADRGRRLARRPGAARPGPAGGRRRAPRRRRPSCATCRSR